ncbi:hypothetical protein A3Q56_01816 [Intoshia linei]|uniref:Uncharacterized protein n=1 Tax=Intoshia linei TaxID=1819745 RepID=A0A177B824_9BILA|nr:hypothetical protein A3Q56_01816 [Intoshia linei]
MNYTDIEENEYEGIQNLFDIEKFIDRLPVDEKIKYYKEKDIQRNKLLNIGLRTLGWKKFKYFTAKVEQDFFLNNPHYKMNTFKLIDKPVKLEKNLDNEINYAERIDKWIENRKKMKLPKIDFTEWTTKIDKLKTKKIVLSQSDESIVSNTNCISN